MLTSPHTRTQGLKIPNPCFGYPQTRRPQWLPRADLGLGCSLTEFCLF